MADGVPATPARSWLDLELGRIWLLAELCLRHLQRAGLRPQSHPAAPDLAAVLAARAAARGGSSEVDALAASLTQADRDVEAARRTSPLGLLARRIGLHRLEVETLMLAISPHIDPPLADLFHVVRGGARRGVNLALVTQLLRLRRDDRVAALSSLDPERPLVAWRLVEVGPADHSDASATSRAIQPTFGLIELLGGGPSSSLARHARLLQAPATLDDLVLPPRLRDPLGRMAAAAAAGPTARGPWTVLWGIAGTGKTTIAARLAAHAGQPLLAFDAMSVDRPQRPELLRLAQRDALALGAALYVGPLVPGDDASAVIRRLDHHPGPVLLGLETSRPPSLRLDRAVREVGLGLPDERGRTELWQRAVDGAASDAASDALAALARSFQLSPGEILATGAEAREIAAGERRAVTYGDLRTGIERRLRNSLQDLAWRIDVRVQWSDLVLPPEGRGRVEEFIARRAFAHKVYGEWGFGDRLERGKGAIALFSGPPGTGKTMLAGLIAQGLGLDLYQVDLSQIQSRWIGETEKQLGRVFDLAERAHAVLLFDEADSLLAKRTDVETSNDRYANANVNYLLQRLEQYTGVVVLTTNKDAALDDALQRRLTLHLRLDVPEVPEREQLWRSFLPRGVPRDPDLDVEALAREFELTGGLIKNVVVRAAFLAAREDTRLGTGLLRRAATLELEDMGRVVRAA
ncbi:MAG TPA: ATP-binding protein [Kofleriaceae bacterium]|jgi:SpoVK/Ycf46/Vps4 family AAA+-type ATPase|nr:ATP-binding protein [Kofleriaceae bacterium]